MGGGNLSGKGGKGGRRVEVGARRGGGCYKRMEGRRAGPGGPKDGEHGGGEAAAQ